MNVVQIDYDEVYTEWYRCPKCGYNKILEEHHFCPDCGKKIADFVARCEETLETDDDFYHCELEIGHSGEHEAKGHKWTEE